MTCRICISQLDPWTIAASADVPAVHGLRHVACDAAERFRQLKRSLHAYCAASERYIAARTRQRSHGFFCAMIEQWVVAYALGLEIKVSRGDWLRERKNPNKSADFRAACSHYVVAPGGVVQPDELPEGWGWIRFVRTRRGDSARATTRAKDTGIVLTPAFFSGCLQRALNPKGEAV